MFDGFLLPRPRARLWSSERCQPPCDTLLPVLRAYLCLSLPGVARFWVAYSDCREPMAAVVILNGSEVAIVSSYLPQSSTAVAPMSLLALTRDGSDDVGS